MGLSRSMWSLPRLRPHFFIFAVLTLGTLVSSEATPGSGTGRDDESAKPTKTTAPIYLPHYDQDDWEAFRGSIISKVRYPSTFLMG